MKTHVHVLALAALLAGCGGSDGDDAVKTTPAPPAAGTPIGPGLTVAQALRSELDGPLLVRGALVADGKHTRLCDALAESYPPQCAGESVEVAGLDLAGFDLERAGQVRWAEQVKLLGTVEEGVLTVDPTATA
ncbi:MAG: hypothetical protein ABR583_11325 [Gaiellaceae bacterium]